MGKQIPHSSVLVDRFVLGAQRVAAYCGNHDLALDLWHVRVEFRKRFEAALIDLVENRLHQHVECVLEYYRQTNHIVAPDQDRIIFSRLVRSLAADESLVATMATLQKLPIGRKASGLRIAALDEGVYRYLPDIAYEELADVFDRLPDTPSDQAPVELPPLPEGYSFADEDEISERLATATELASLPPADEQIASLAAAKAHRCKPARKKKSKPVAKKTRAAKPLRAAKRKP